MTSKLEEIKQALEKYDDSRIQYPKDTFPEEIGNEYRQTEKFLELAPEALRLLLPIVEAAVKLIAAEKRDENSTEEFFELRDAVEAFLKGTPPVNI